MPAFSISDARYAKRKKLIQVFDGREGMKGRAAYLADAVGGRWSNRSKGYVVSAAAAQKFEILFYAGFEAHVRVFNGQKASLYHTERKLDELSIAGALKLAKEG